MTIQGVTRPLQRKFKFKVVIDDFVSFAFKTCSEITTNVDVVEHREGGALIPDKQPGLVNIPNVTLERGVSTDADMWAWMQLVVSQGFIPGPARGSTANALFKRNIHIVQYSRNGLVELKRWILFGCFPVEFKGGDWDNEANENTMERMVLAYDYPILVSSTGI